MPSALSHLFVTTTDLARAKAFWTALGLEILVDEGGDVRIGGGGGFHVGLEQGRSGADASSAVPAPTAAIERDGHGPTTGGPELEVVVRVDDVDATCDRLRTAGFAITHGPIRTEWGSDSAWTVDPDGRSVSFRQAEPGERDGA